MKRPNAIRAFAASISTAALLWASPLLAQAPAVLTQGAAKVRRVSPADFARASGASVEQLPEHTHAETPGAIDQHGVPRTVARAERLPFEDNSATHILMSHVLEHIQNPLPMMEELYRVAKPGCLMVIACPYGSSDDAWEDPTHVRPIFASSTLYFSQPAYWKADYEIGRAHV